MNLRLMLGVWAAGVALAAVMVAGERAKASRFRRMVDGIDTTGTVVARGLSTGAHSTVFDIAYTDHHGVQHTLRKVALTGHIDIGSQIALRYEPGKPGAAAAAPQHVLSPRWQAYVVVALFAAIGLGLGLVG